MPIFKTKPLDLRTTLARVWSIVASLWRVLRQLTGDDAYERYLQHHAAEHDACGHPPLTRKAFFKQWQDQQWQGVKRCC